MSWHYSLVLVAVYSVHSCSDGEPSAPLSASPTASNPSSSDSETDSLSTSPSGTMCRPSTGDPGVDAWIASLRASHVSHSPLPVNSKPQTMSATCGPKPLGSFAKFDPAGYCWRTSQASLLLPTGTCTPYSETWPKAGMIVDGAAYRLSQPVRPTSETGSGLWPTPAAWDGQRGARKPDGKRGMALSDLTKAHLWPTPAARDYKGANSEEHLSKARGHLDQLPNAVQMAGHQDGSLNPPWVEWLMGYPVGWTDLKVLGTASSLKSSKKSQEQSSVPIND